MDHTRQAAETDTEQQKGGEPGAGPEQATARDQGAGAEDAEQQSGPVGGDAPAAADQEAAEGTSDGQAGVDGGQAGSDGGSVPEGDGAEEDPQVAALRREAEEHYQRLLRLQADYDNFRRRTRQEKEDFAKYASMQVMERLLPVLDNFERAIAAGRNTDDLDSFLKGVDMIFRQLTDVLGQEGLTPIKAVGEPFNPKFHQAVMQVESDEHEDGIIVEELQKGYMLKERVIRPSMVKVNAKP